VQLGTQVFAAESALDDTEEKWDFLRRAALATGAFPFAFRVIDLIRDISDFARADLNLSRHEETKRFSYTDGGVFQNEPLGLAKELVDQSPPSQDSNARFYLFVAPGSKPSQVVRTFCAENADLFRTATRLIASIREQAAFQDWIETEKTNQRVKLFEDGARLLQKLFKQVEPAYTSAFAKAMTDILPEASQERSEQHPNISESLQDARNRLRNRFKREYDSLPDQSKEPWLDTILFLKTAAGLTKKDQMEVYSVTVESCQLAGGALSAFAGFFEKAYRQHDYDLGRVAAREFICKLNKTSFANAATLGPIDYGAATEQITIRHELDGLKLDSMDRKVRICFRNRLRARFRDLMQQSPLKLWIFGPPLRCLADFFIVRPWLDSLLQLRTNRS